MSPLSGVVQLYGKIYALGGHNGLSIFESVECLDPNAPSTSNRGSSSEGGPDNEGDDDVGPTWTESVPMLSKRCRLGVAALGGKIYACGGYDGSSFLKSVECFDPVANT